MIKKSEAFYINRLVTNFLIENGRSFVMRYDARLFFNMSMNIMQVLGLYVYVENESISLTNLYLRHE